MIEYYTDGTAWVACTKERPQLARTVRIDQIVCRVYHPEAVDLDDGSEVYEGDSHYRCPNCKKDWWVERDG